MMHRLGIRSIGVIYGLLFAFAANASTISGLNQKQFNKYWKIESESPNYRLTFMGDTCEILSPKGLTLWRKEKMQANMTVEYDVCVVDEGKEGDRLSDMNCFWLASDPHQKDIWKRADWRSGIFLRCYTLQTYYLGYGGNSNTTTRFRRYGGNEAGVSDESQRPPILQEYTDASHLLKANHWYHLKIEGKHGHVRFYVDDELLVDYCDPNPLESGWFGFRTTWSRIRMTNFKYAFIEEMSVNTGIPLHWVGEVPQKDRPVAFGVPFAKGEIKDVSKLALFANGIEQPTDVWVNARWDDGSVKWAGFSTVVPHGLDKLNISFRSAKHIVYDSQTYHLRNESPQLVKCKLNVYGIQTYGLPNQYRISTGKIDVFIPKQGNCLIDSLLMYGEKMGGACHLVASLNDGSSFVSDIQNVVIERQGKASAVVKIMGVHKNETRKWLPFTVRLYFYAQSEQVKMVHSFVYDGEQTKDFIASLGIRFHIPMREQVYNRHVAFACDGQGVWSEPVQPLDGRINLRLENQNWQAKQMNGERIPEPEAFDERGQSLLHHWAKWDCFRLSQLTDNSFSIRKKATKESPWIGTFTGNRSNGYVFVGDVSGGMSVMMKDFWQSYPSSIEVTNARTENAALTMWMWSPEAESMNLCHYDTIAHDLLASYEDVQEGLSTPYGIARTNVLWLSLHDSYMGKEGVADWAQYFEDDAQLQCTPEYLYAKRAFGIWSLPDTTSVASRNVERRLNQYLDFYRNAVEENKWYGFWNYGDFMHAYDVERHSWRYDIGGYAWDNTELATPEWLWYSFLRTGRKDVWRMAEAMTRHNSEVDSYHIGELAGLGSRHNVSHWGCGAKEARISQAAFNRFYYYLTTDERTGDLMDEVKDADQKLYTLDPMRLAEPRSKYPCSAPARLRFGLDWLAYAGNWMTYWERTGDTHYRDKIVAGLKSVVGMKDGLFTGNNAWGFNPATGVMSYEGDERVQHTNHLMTIMGGFEMMNELSEMVSVEGFDRVWLDYASNYKRKAFEITHNHFPVRRLLAYAAWKQRNPNMKSEAWKDLWGRIEHEEAPSFHISKITPPQVPSPLTEWNGISTNDAALWSLDAIYMQEVIKQF